MKGKKQVLELGLNVCCGGQLDGHLFVAGMGPSAMTVVASSELYANH